MTPAADPARRSRFLAFAGFRVDTLGRKLYRGAEAVRVTPRIFDLLLAFLERPGAVLTRDELLDAVWGESIVEDANLTQSVFVLRRILGDDAQDQAFIVTESGVGYRFVREVRAVEPAAAGGVAGPDPDRRPRPRRRAALRLGLAAGALAAAALAAVLLRPAGRSAPPPPDPGELRTLAVLPFEVPAGTASPAAGLALARALAPRLAQRYAVAPLGTVLDYLRPQADPADLGRRLRVDAVLTGALRRDGDTARAEVRLISSRDGATLRTWSFGAPAGSEPGQLQDAVVSGVMASLAPGIGPATDGPPDLGTASFRAYEQVVMGLYQLSRRDAAGLTAAQASFAAALDEDPGYAAAWSGLADAEFLLGTYWLGELPARERFRRADDAAKHALAIDPGLPEPHLILGMLALQWALDPAAAGRHFQRALELGPELAQTHHWAAFFLLAEGRPEAARSRLARARELDPLSLIVRSAEAAFAFYAGRYEEAVATCDRVLEVQDGFGRAHLTRGLALEQLGRFAAADAALRRAAQSLGETDEVRSARAHLAGAAGQTRLWRERTAQLADASPYLRAVALAGGGRATRRCARCGAPWRAARSWSGPCATTPACASSASAPTTPPCSARSISDRGPDGRPPPHSTPSSTIASATTSSWRCSSSPGTRRFQEPRRNQPTAITPAATFDRANAHQIPRGPSGERSARA